MALASLYHSHRDKSFRLVSNGGHMKTLLAILVVMGFSAHANNGVNCNGMQSGNIHTAPMNLVKSSVKTPVKTDSVKGVAGHP